MRATHAEVEQLYRDGMTIVFKSNDQMKAIKQREVSHHIKDCVDIFNRIVVRLI